MKTYPLFKVHVHTEAALAEIKKVFESGYINEGAQVTELTKALSMRMQTGGLCLTNSCTSAITMALKLAGVKSGDEVVSTPMTCVATNTPIVNLGANIAWADIDPKTGMVDSVSIARKINRRTKAVIAVAWAGTPPELDALERECEARGVKLILDAAHAFDAQYDSHPVHRWADMTCYSFQAIKHFTTGDGGALVCSHPKDHERAKAMKWFGLDRDHAKDAKGDWRGQQWDVDIAEAGYKFNMNNVAAAIGLSQLPLIDGIMAAHRYNAVVYNELFADCMAVRPLKRSTSAKSSHWVYTVRLDPKRTSVQRDDLLKALNAEGIMAGVVHVPNDGYSCFRMFSDELRDLPGVREFAANQFSLPCGWWLEDADIRHIARRVMELTR